MEPLTTAEIHNLTPEQITELNRRMASKILKRFFLIQVAKWVLIIGVIAAVKKALEPNETPISETEN